MDDFKELANLKAAYLGRPGWGAILLLARCVLGLRDRVRELERAREQTETYEADMRERGL